jgi:hypothetical protein
LPELLMTIKCTIFMQQTTNTSKPFSAIHRVGGWSESYYFGGVDVNACIKAFQTGVGGTLGLGPTRANLLANGAAIVGQRFQIVAPSIGQSQSSSYTYTPTGSYVADQPQMALLIKVPGNGVPNIRRVILRGIPDQFIVDGEFAPNLDFLNLLGQFLAELSNWQFRGRDLTQPAFKIITIAIDGTVTCEAVPTFAVNQMVRVLRTMNSGGDLVGGRFQVTTTGPSPVAFKLLNWTQGACTGGTVRADAIIYPQMAGNLASIGRAVVKKVGRPFVGYRGRRSAVRT